MGVLLYGVGCPGALGRNADVPPPAPQDSGWGWPAPPSGTDDPALLAYPLYWDATAAGVADAEAATGARLRYGGTASGKAARDAWYLPALLDHKADGGVNAFTGAPVRWDFVTAHVKGESTSYVTVQGEWAVSALFRSKPSWAAATAGLSVSNDEGDPMVGWEKPVPWRGDARYAAIIPKMVNQHLLAIRDNATTNNPLGVLSFDGLFLNGIDDSYVGFGERTMAVRFGAPLNTAPFALVRKNGLAAFTLLSMLGNARCAYTGATGAADVLSANSGVLATARAGEAAVLVYNSADCTDDTGPAVAVAVNVTGLDFAPTPADGSVVAVLYAISDATADSSPVLAWQAMGSPVRLGGSAGGRVLVGKWGRGPSNYRPVVGCLTSTPHPSPASGNPDCSAAADTLGGSSGHDGRNGRACTHCCLCGRQRHAATRDGSAARRCAVARSGARSGALDTRHALGCERVGEARRGVLRGSGQPRGLCPLELHQRLAHAEPLCHRLQRRRRLGLGDGQRRALSRGRHVLLHARRARGGRVLPRGRH